VLSAQHGRIGARGAWCVNGEGQVLRAALQPLQIRFSAQQRGELAQLRGAEALDAAPPGRPGDAGRLLPE
jgi:DNA repair protein RecO (recombination protein O)